MRDYYAFQRMQLDVSLRELEQAASQLRQAKRLREKQARKEAVGKAEREMRRAANKAAQIEPHLAYLWFEACNSELDNSIRIEWQELMTANPIPSDFHFLPDISAISYMPVLSFILKIPFRLQKPFISKDERDFHLLNNSLRKEKVFQTPMIAATSWKGALRATLWQLGHKQDDPITIRLLGTEHKSEEPQAGRLYFFPTFFNKSALEVINPHDRQTGTGARGPILMECVRQGARGDLILLYVPFGPTEQTKDARRAEVAEDLQVLAKGIHAMLTVFGFGAKTSSGFGIAEDQLGEAGRLVIRAKLDGVAAPAEVTIEDLSEYPINSLRELCEELVPSLAVQIRKGGGKA